MTEEKLPRPLSNAERHAKTLQCIKNAITCLKAAVRAQDGLEWDGQLREHLESLEYIAKRIPHYAGLKETHHG